MTFERTITTLVFRGLASLALAAAAVSPAAFAHSTSMTMSSDKTIRECGDVRVTFSDSGDDELPSVRSEERLTLPAPPQGALSVAPPQSGGVYVSGWDGNGYEVVACRVAAGRTEENARATLDKITVRRDPGGLGASGPDGSLWTAYFIVKAPRGASLDLSVENGGIDTRDVIGKIHARSTNGPISIEGCSGEIDASAENGPVSLGRSTGDIRIRTQNGPISVSLPGKWEGGQIDARAINGPLTLELPAGFRPGVRVETSRYAPFRCDAAACDGSNYRSGSGGIRLDLGGSERKVFVSTDNGPMSIVAPDGEI